MKKEIISNLEFFLSMKKIPTVTHQKKRVSINKRTSKPIFYESYELGEARSKYLSLLYPYAPESPLPGAIRLTVKWLFPRTKKSKNGQYKVTKPDTDNLQKLFKDCMTEMGFWNDDAQVASELIEKFWSDTVGIYVKVECLEERNMADE